MMYVVKRNGQQERVHFDKITQRIQNLSFGLNTEFVDPSLIAKEVVRGVYRGVRTSELDILAAETAASYASDHMDYSILAGRICSSNLHKTTIASFSETMTLLYEYKTKGKSGSLIADDVYAFVQENKDRLDGAIDHSRDYDYDYFGINTLMKSYLLRMDGDIVERPQHMLMRVSCGIHCGDVEGAIETYDGMSRGYFTHASPTLFNSGTRHPQMSSCFLVNMKSDSIRGIYSTLSDCAEISKNAGGIGLSVSKIRAKNSYIRGTNGVSNGLVPMLRVFNATARYVDQGGGKRRGAFAIYLEPWHADILDFLELRKNHGQDDVRARDLFYALWVCDLFMKRVQNNQNWSLFCPDEAPGLCDLWGDAFDAKYEEYEAVEGLARTTMPAQELMKIICRTQIETGQPYMLYKDACNRKSNHQHLGCISSSNLCTEIIEYSSPDEIAVCNLASISLPKCVDQKTMTFSFERLGEITRIVTRNLNRVIDRNYYPLPETRRSNFRHRPMGIGVQGLSDVFAMLHLPYESKEAQQLNKDIFQVMYYHALVTSCELAKVEGPYDSYEGSPVSQGILQHDMWGVQVDNELCDWDVLRKNIAEHGVRNSLLIAPMPTASTSQILGNTESFEPRKSNAYVRKTMVGEFVCFSRYLVNDLVKLGLWNEQMKQKLIRSDGSIQTFSEIPPHIRDVYKTVVEMKGRVLIQMAADRGAFIDQSQSFNVHLKNPKYSVLYSFHHYAWSSGLKTGMYYLRSSAATQAIKYTINDHTQRDEQTKEQDVCDVDCLSCGS